MVESTKRIERVQLPSGKSVYVEVVALPGEEDIGVKIPSMDQVIGAIDEVVDMLWETMQRAKPTTASVEFGVDFTLEAGALTALIVKGSGTGSLTITLEWEGESKDSGS
jgi:hypothetical protein